MHFRPYQPIDCSRVLEINAACRPEVGPLGESRLNALAARADYFFVLEVDGLVCGFLIGLREGTAYPSPNYKWFAERYSQFAYIDRIAIDTEHRGSGAAKRFYADFEQWSREAACPVMCAEVNVEPPNPRSLRFHASCGFREVAQFEPTGSADYRVSMLVKRLAA